ncbi:hypothetical protein CYLTODRAFT_417860 [Cylindrobasidium torrendii FP15055 ss-10]|uniref:F-box domain-containing protein n=1 Tax=Cylindrobasidium torrendii FP15055 ss-10 TaxID=1314674 RepID=A0A0D7BPV4_9AGAR|nr:hypothetical protein CYLTODRAFT_417860 [Cylindrobasidium torrendii FP15055 ss-10]
MSGCGWKDLNKHVLLAQQGDDLLGMYARFPADDEARRKVVDGIAQSLEQEIDKAARKKLAEMPKPNASVDTWAAHGVADENLFADDLMDGCAHLLEHREGPAFTDSPLRRYARRRTWETLSFMSYKPVILFLQALTDPRGPFHHLPSFLYLAHHARVPLYRLNTVNARNGGGWNFANANPPGPPPFPFHIPFGSLLDNYIQLTLAYYILLCVFEELDQGPVALENGAVRRFTSFPSWYGICHVNPRVGPVTPPTPPPPMPAGIPPGAIPPIASDDWFLDNHDSLHCEFWRASTDSDRKEHDARLRAEYKQQCLDVVVAWWTVMIAASDRNKAIDITTEQGRDGPAPMFFLAPRLLDKVHNTLDILGHPLTRTTWHPPMPSSSPPYTPSPELLPPPPTAEQTLLFELSMTPASFMLESSIASQFSNVPERAVQLSRFLDLPPELLLHIINFLPLDSVVALSKVCTSLHRLCTPRIYENPMELMTRPSPVPPAFSSDSGWPSERTGLSAFISLHRQLLARPDLRSHIRVMPLQTVGYDNPRMLSFYSYALPLTSPLAAALPNLSSMRLNLSMASELSGEKASGVSQDALRRLVAGLAQQYPCMRDLALTFTYTTYHLADGADAFLNALPSIDTDRETHLRTFSINRYDAFHPPVTGDHTSIPVSSLLRPCAATLEFAMLHVSQDDLGALNMFPILQRVEELDLECDIPPRDLQLWLLRCFPGLRLLVLRPRRSHAGHHNLDETWPQLTGSTLDLEFACPNLVELDITAYKPGQLPLSVQRVTMDVRDLLGRGPLSALLTPESLQTVSPHVQGIRLARDWSAESWYTQEQLVPIAQSIGIMYPALRCVELENAGFQGDGIDWMSAELEDVYTFLDPLTSALSNLDVLIMTFSYFTCRPRRRDYPMDDGVDEIERAYASALFERYTSLRFLSLTGSRSEEASAQERRSLRRRLWARAPGGKVKEVNRGWLPDYCIFRD